MKLSDEQLKGVHDLQNEFNSTKMALADAAFKQSLIVKKLGEIQTSFQEMEASLIEEFGQDSVINLQTGEVKSKEEAEAEEKEVEESKEELKKV
jgi:hypothetical protein|tara:strand:+ start:1634 stop:1915 length:282 start_codon:yes stop_codon:yes gene_type:complete